MASMHFASAYQYRFQIVPDIFQLPCLKRLPLSRSGAANTVQFPTVWALAGFGPSFHFKVAVITDKDHSLYTPIQHIGSLTVRLPAVPFVLLVNCQYTTHPRIVQAIAVLSLFCTRYSIHNSELGTSYHRKSSPQRASLSVKTTNPITHEA